MGIFSCFNISLIRECLTVNSISYSNGSVLNFSFIVPFATDSTLDSVKYDHLSSRSVLR